MSHFRDKIYVVLYTLKSLLNAERCGSEVSDTYFDI
jgi:hypothetical protein